MNVIPPPRRRRISQHFYSVFPHARPCHAKLSHWGKIECAYVQAGYATRYGFGRKRQNARGSNGGTGDAMPWNNETMGTRPISEEIDAMTMLNDTMDTVGNAMDNAKNTMGHAVDSAKHAAGSAKKSTERAASVAFSDITSGIRAATEVISMIRNFGVDDALGWIGLARRRQGYESIAIFGSGMIVGAGIGMIFAPMSGADLRKAFLKRLQGAEKEVEKVAGAVKDAVVNAEHKVEDAACKAKDTVVGAAKDIVHNAEEKVHDAKDAVLGAAKDVAVGAAKEAVAGAAKDVVDGAEQKVKDVANKAKDALDGADRKADVMSDKARDAISAAERKADIMSDKAQDAIAAAERRNNGAAAQGQHRHGARNQ